MKQLAIVTVLAFALVSCKDDNNIPKVPVHVALHHQFEEDHVVVKIDEIVLIDGVATTNPSLGVSYVNGKSDASKYLPKGAHKIEVQLKGSVVEFSEFDLVKTVYVGISFDPTTSAFSFLYSDEPFMYD